jgi:glycosyltransferase involved in cell wall biosynthesis
VKGIETSLELKSPQSPKTIPRLESRTSKCLIVICAYNEEKSLPTLLELLRGRDVLVIDDGSSDGTKRIAESFGITLISHEERCGKAATLADGISYALQNSYDYIIEIGADAIPMPGTLKKIQDIMDTGATGGVSCKQIPIGVQNAAYHIDELIWAILSEGKARQMELHGSCHLGAVLFAFRPKLVKSIEGSTNDDEKVGISIMEQGHDTVFLEDAQVYFDASSSLGHIVERRRRMYYGHMCYKESTAPSMELSTSLVALIRAILSDYKRILWFAPTLVIDCYARLTAWADSRRVFMRNKYKKWVTTFAKNEVTIMSQEKRRLQIDT